MTEASGCPFCGFTPSQGEYELLLVNATCHGQRAQANPGLQHMETLHAEGRSPFVAAASQHHAATVHQPGSSAESGDAGTARKSPARASKPDASQRSRVVLAWKTLFDGHGKSPANDHPKRRVRHRDKSRKEEADASLQSPAPGPAEAETKLKRARLGVRPVKCPICTAAPWLMLRRRNQN